ncbi:thioredoxin-like protein [Mucor mucedo]|uniref:thioredoxin-like protein n=1 Tax=Mucor mucedo TaxID=29922 RepID=UPI00221F7CAE|nr:thioredoxin-like protein [Mucor mucedo]KAI7887737.1 thioredoxin-like protein [Mucor mucedo]
MAMLMTDNFIPHECETRKRRRVEQGDTNSFEDTTITINPVQQVDRLCMIAPNFNCAAVLNDQVNRLQLSNLLHEYKAVVLFFYECDFAPSACNDLQAINRQFERFQSYNTMPLAMSTDTEMVHTAFIAQSGFTPSFPLVADTTRSVSRHFNVINDETGFVKRGAFIIDQTRQVRFSFVLEDNRISHSMDTICAILQNI